MALDETGAREVDILEMHGTGTGLGDPIEVDSTASHFLKHAQLSTCSCLVQSGVYQCCFGCDSARMGYMSCSWTIKKAFTALLDSALGLSSDRDRQTHFAVAALWAVKQRRTG